MEIYGKIDSKYRFVVLAAKRAKQLLKGAKPKIESKSKNLIRIAQTEVRSGLIEYDVLPADQDEVQDEDVFAAEESEDGIPDAESLSESSPSDDVEEDDDDIAEEEAEEDPLDEEEEDEGDKND